MVDDVRPFHPIEVLTNRGAVSTPLKEDSEPAAGEFTVLEGYGDSISEALAALGQALSVAVSEKDWPAVKSLTEALRTITGVRAKMQGRA
jgi:hypothetical protein